MSHESSHGHLVLCHSDDARYAVEQGLENSKYLAASPKGASIIHELGLSSDIIFDAKYYLEQQTPAFQTYGNVVRYRKSTYGELPYDLFTYSPTVAQGIRYLKVSDISYESRSLIETRPERQQIRIKRIAGNVAVGLSTLPGAVVGSNFVGGLNRMMADGVTWDEVGACATGSIVAPILSYVGRNVHRLAITRKLKKSYDRFKKDFTANQESYLKIPLDITVDVPTHVLKKYDFTNSAIKQWKIDDRSIYFYNMVNELLSNSVNPDDLWIESLLPAISNIVATREAQMSISKELPAVKKLVKNLGSDKFNQLDDVKARSEEINKSLNKQIIDLMTQLELTEAKSRMDEALTPLRAS